MKNYKLIFLKISKEKKESKDYDIDFYLTTDTTYTINAFKELTYSEQLYTIIREVTYKDPNSCIPTSISFSGHFLNKIADDEKDSVNELTGDCLLKILKKYNIKADSLFNNPRTFIIRINESNSFDIEEVD